jgi:hypothetical protein
MKQIFLTLFFATTVFCQDSLYLIGTITGESNAKRITDVKGIGDVNGDGYDDFMVSSGYHNVTLYLGSANFNLTPSVVFHYPAKDNLINSFGGGAGIGDVNGDGYNDFLLLGNFADYGSDKGKVFLYYGGSNIDTIPKYEFYEPWVQDWFGKDMEGVGDINKDGYDDFVICSPYNWSNGKGRVYLFYGGDMISFARSITFVDTLAIGNILIDSFFGISVANIGDINRDGFEDIAISAGYDPSEGPEKVYIYYGGATMDTIPDTVLNSNQFEYSFGRKIINAGDLNKDGVTDFCIAGAYNIFVYDGINQFNEPFLIKGAGLGAGGDINNDGYDDLIVGFWDIKIFFGAENFDTTNYLIIGDPQHSLGFSGNISISGDINDDGYDDIFAFSPYWPNPDSALGKLFIYSYKNLTDVKGNKQIAPRKFELYQNYPNPFNPKTVISYQLSVSSYTTLKVYDVLGRLVRTLVDGIQKSGEHIVNFDGSGLSSGVYLYRLSTNHSVLQRTMVLIK